MSIKPITFNKAINEELGTKNLRFSISEALNLRHESSIVVNSQPNVNTLKLWIETKESIMLFGHAKEKLFGLLKVINTSTSDPRVINSSVKVEIEKFDEEIMDYLIPRDLELSKIDFGEWEQNDYGISPMNELSIDYHIPINQKIVKISSYNGPPIIQTKFKFQWSMANKK